MPDLERIVFGTAALGLPYGLAREGTKPTLMPDDRAFALVARALDAGIDTFDTAPAYGEAERRLGEALRGRGTVWTKVGNGDQDVDASLGRLQRARIDVLQWHNWTAELGNDERFLRIWEALRARPDVGLLGATTYGKHDALAAVRSGLFGLVQIEWNVLNQGVLAHVGEEATRRGVRIAVRSVFLQGALTDEGRTLPALPRLRAGVDAARALARRAGMSLTALALRAALDAPGAGSVLVGLDALEQPADLARIAALPPLSAALRGESEALDLGGDPSTDPRTW